MARARDERGAWQCKRFPVTSWHRDGSPVLPEGAVEWARATRRTFIRGEAVAIAATFQDHADLLATNLAAAGVSDQRAAFIRSIAKALEAEGVTDMRSDVFPARVRTWITGLKAGWSMPADAKNRRTSSTPLAAPTRNKVLTACRQVTGLAVKKRRLAFDPLAELPRFREVTRQKPLFSIAELRQMVGDEARDHANHELAELTTAITARMDAGDLRVAAIKAVAKARKEHWASIYNALKRPAQPDPWWLACCLLVYTGCRAAEAMHLRWEWVKFTERIITLKLTDDYDSKTDSERLIPLEPELAAILLPIRRDIGHILPPEIRAGGSGVKKRKSSENGKGAQDYTAAFGRFLNRINMEIGDRTAHSLRHCYITMKLARADMNVERLRKAVGHMDFSTTMGYGTLSQMFEAEVDGWPDATLWLRRDPSLHAIEPKSGRTHR
ncbi:MAG: site-specific integrase [Planctomycetes bacterium]|nr:site-specific integrase [Planctomycetota bacterium]